MTSSTTLRPPSAAAVRQASGRSASPRREAVTMPEVTTAIVLPSVIGDVVVEGDEARITRVWLPDSAPIEVLDRATAPDHATPAALGRAASQLEEYFAGTRRAFDLPLALGGTSFQRSVWLALARIDYGSTWTYGELAAAVGHPAAYRAVGQANGSNPIPIILPCHRVVASGGRLGGYGGGLPMKRALLTLEGVGELRS